MAKGNNKKKGTDKNKPAKTLKEKKQDKKDKKKGTEQSGLFPASVSYTHLRASSAA